MIHTLMLISLLYYGANNAFAAEIQLSCTAPAKSAYVEGVDDLGCSCFGPGNNLTTFEWTFTQNTGQQQTLARCTHLGSCQNFFPSDFEVRLISTLSDLSFTNLTSRYAGSITCTQSNSTFRGSASYTIKLTRVSMSTCQGGMALQEDSSDGQLLCEHSPYYPSTVTWTIATYSGQLLHVGNCRGAKNFKYNCTSPLSPNITLTSDKTSSFISFGNNFINRDLATVICSASFSNYTEADNCTLDIYHPATVENCSLEIIPHNWSLSFSCDVDQVFSSKEEYDFSVFETFNILKNGQLMTADSNLIQESTSYRHFLTSYTNSTDNRKYYRGRITYTWFMLPDPGSFQNLAFQSTHSGKGQLDFPNGFNISLPARPRHNCSDVTTPSPCSCSTETLGLPAGRLLWLIGNATVAVGDYGVNELLLPLNNLPSGKDVTVATCQLDWIQFFVAKKPVIRRKPDASDDGTSRLLTIVSWTMLCVVIVFDVVVVVILVRWGQLPGFPRKNSSEQPED